MAVARFGGRDDRPGLLLADEGLCIPNADVVPEGMENWQVGGMLVDRIDCQGASVILEEGVRQHRGVRFDSPIELEMKDHAVDRFFGVSASEWMARIPNELDVDAVG